MYQIQRYEPPFKRIRVDRPEIKDVELRRRRAQNDRRLKSVFESIFDKYEKDFEGIGDEIDLETGGIVVDNGHVSGLEYQPDIFGHDVGFDVDSGSGKSEEHCNLGATIEVYNDDVIENGRVPDIGSSSPWNITPRMGALKKHPIAKLANARPLRLGHDYEDELGIGSTASHSLQPGPIVRHDPWLLKRSEITRRGRSISPIWATPDLPMSTPRHFHRRLNALPPVRPHWEYSNGKTSRKCKTHITPRPSPALNLVRSNNAPDSADAPTMETERHGQRKTVDCPTSPCQSETDELGMPEPSQGIPAREADRSWTEERFTDCLPLGFSRLPTPSDSSHELNVKQTEPVGDVLTAMASPTSSSSSSILRRSSPLDDSAPAKIVSQTSLGNNHIQNVDSFPIPTGSLPSIEQTFIPVRRSKRQRRRKLDRFGARDTSEDMQDAVIPNLQAKNSSSPQSLKELLSDRKSVVREIPDSDSPLSSQPRLAPSSGTPPRLLNVQTSDQIMSTSGIMSDTSSPDRDKAPRDDERPSPVIVGKHSAPQDLKTKIDPGVQTKVQDVGFRSSGVKVVIPLRKERTNLPYRSFDKCFLHDEGKADAVDSISRPRGLPENTEPHQIFTFKADGKSGRPGEEQVTEIPDSQPSRELLYHNCDTDVDLGPNVVPDFIVSDGVMDRRAISNSPIMSAASSESLAVPCTPAAKLTTDTKGVDEQQRQPLRSQNTPKPPSATKGTLSEMWDGNEDDLTILLSGAKPSRRSKSVRSGVLIRKSIVSDMATSGDDELA